MTIYQPLALPLPLVLADISSYGFLPTRASFVLDTLFVAMFMICMVLALSIGMVRFGRQFQMHRRLQTGLAIVLGIAVIIFEIDIRFFTDWRALAEPSQFYASGTVDRALWFHLAFAIPTPFVWAYVVVQAMKKFPKKFPKSFPQGSQPAEPNPHRASHRFWGWVATILMVLTSVTGCTFYWLAFAC